jgi:hypothetical protein
MLTGTKKHDKKTQLRKEPSWNGTVQIAPRYFIQIVQKCLIRVK